MKLDFATLDVFTEERLQGNPLGVILLKDGQDISDDLKLSIAKEFNLSESIFVYPPTLQGEILPSDSVNSLT